MTISEVWKSYSEYTSGVTEQSRKLGFAIAAACWFFRTPEVSVPPTHALWSLVWVILFFFLDLLQYITAAVMTRTWARSQEKKVYRQQQELDANIEKPAWLDTPATVFFALKLVSLLISFGFLAREFLNHV